MRWKIKDKMFQNEVLRICNRVDGYDGHNCDDSISMHPSLPTPSIGSDCCVGDGMTHVMATL